jgi:hypothetical protein
VLVVETLMFRGRNGWAGALKGVDMHLETGSETDTVRLYASKPPRASEQASQEVCKPTRVWVREGHGERR